MKCFRDMVVYLRSPGARFLLGVFIAAIAIRIIVWALIPPLYTHLSDERGYINAGIDLARDGKQDLFWPPLTGWLVAIASYLFSSSSISLFRFLWIIIDAANMVLLVVICLRFARLIPTGPITGRGTLLATSLLALYAIYPPFIGFSAFVVSETPALFLLLLLITFLGDPSQPSPRMAIFSGLAAGFLVLTRSNLAGLAVSIPIVLAVSPPKK